MIATASTADRQHILRRTVHARIVAIVLRVAVLVAEDRLFVAFYF